MFALFAFPIRAQKGGGPSGGSSGGSRGGAGGGTVVRPSAPPIFPGTQPAEEPTVLYPTISGPLPKPVIAEDEACLPWPVPDVRGATVSAVRLGVPSKARSQYEKACSSYKKKKLAEAEEHARGAIQEYAKYPAAWVMLGQILQEEQKMDEARDACSKPMSVDPAYLPPYLCVAGLLELEKNWGDLLTWSDRFLGMNPAGDLYANYYKGLAQFHVRDLAEAQKSVTLSIAIDTEHHQPALYFLLAQIYGEQRDLPNATLQIRQFLKFSKNQQNKDSAKEYLSELQSELNAK